MMMMMMMMHHDYMAVAIHHFVTVVAIENTESWFNGFTGLNNPVTLTVLNNYNNPTSTVEFLSEFFNIFYFL
jgi:hypothetical protein